MGTQPVSQHDQPGKAVLQGRGVGNGCAIRGEGRWEGLPGHGQQFGDGPKRIPTTPSLPESRLDPMVCLRDILIDLWFAMMRPGGNQVCHRAFRTLEPAAQGFGFDGFDKPGLQVGVHEHGTQFADVPGADRLVGRSKRFVLETQVGLAHIMQQGDHSHSLQDDLIQRPARAGLQPEPDTPELDEPVEHSCHIQAMLGEAQPRPQGSVRSEIQLTPKS